MSQYAEEALALATVVGAPGDGAAEPALVPGKGALGLPPLAEHPLVPVALGAGAEVPGHLGPVLAARFAIMAARVDRDYRRADAQLLPRLSVVRLGVERGVRQHPVPKDQQGRQEQDRGELRGVVGRAGGDGGTGDEVRMRVEGGGQLRPGAGRVLGAAAGDEVSGGVAAIQAGGIDGRSGPLGDQAAVECGRDGALEEVDEDPPFKSRPSA